MLMSACASINRDGAPLQFPDVSDIADAAPSVEPSSKQGNPQRYEINGIQYFPQKERLGFTQTGIASWYGTKFHGRLTSNGEVYDMYKMTAAHKTLPLPTYVNVSNLENGKSIMVRVNDRGPFVEDRIIDLSYVAAIKLVMTHSGTARVRVDAWSANSKMLVQSGNINTTQNSDRVEDYVEPSIETTVLHDDNRRYYIQLGSFANRQNAKKLKSKLLTLTQESVTISPVQTHLGIMYRVQLGPFDQKEKLISIEQSFRQLGYTQQTRTMTSVTP